MTLQNGLNVIFPREMFSVNVENSFSDKALISCGVPQGSILGPLVLALRK